MSERNQYSGGAVLAAFLGGAAAGAFVAVLTAPKSGKESREQVRAYLHDRGEDASRLPQAVRAAGDAAKEAFAESMHPSP